MCAVLRRLSGMSLSTDNTPSPSGNGNVAAESTAHNQTGDLALRQDRPSKSPLRIALFSHVVFMRGKIFASADFIRIFLQFIQGEFDTEQFHDE